MVREILVVTYIVYAIISISIFIVAFINERDLQEEPLFGLKIFKLNFFYLGIFSALFFLFNAGFGEFFLFLLPEEIAKELYFELIAAKFVLSAISSILVISYERELIRKIIVFKNTILLISCFDTKLASKLVDRNYYENYKTYYDYTIFHNEVDLPKLFMLELIDQKTRNEVYEQTKKIIKYDYFWNYGFVFQLHGIDREIRNILSFDTCFNKEKEVFFLRYTVLKINLLCWKDKRRLNSFAFNKKEEIILEFYSKVLNEYFNRRRLDKDRREIIKSKYVPEDEQKLISLVSHIIKNEPNVFRRWLIN